MTQTPPAILEIRKEIDAIDNQLLALLDARSQFVKKVGAIKHQYQDNQTVFIRSAREADMVRRVYVESKKGIFPALAAAQLWRVIICASLSLESSLTIAAFAPAGNEDLYWLSREYFGSFTPVFKHSFTADMIAQMQQGSIQVGVVPLTGAAWWQTLPDTMKVFACVPFMMPQSEVITAVAIATIFPEPTGNDISLLRVTGELSSLTQLPEHRILASDNDHHLVSIAGFLTQDDASELARKTAQKLTLTSLGAYAAPIYY